jgi:hypothetical protein
LQTSTSNDVFEKINTLEAKVAKVEKSYSTAVNQSPVNDDKKLNIVKMKQITINVP